MYDERAMHRDLVLQSLGVLLLLRLAHMIIHRLEKTLDLLILRLVELLKLARFPGVLALGHGRASRPFARSIGFNVDDLGADF